MLKNLRNTLYFWLVSFIILSAIVVALSAKAKFVGYWAKPSFSNTYKTVVLDAGHGGEDGGAIGKNKVLEKDLNLSITLKIGERLKKQGINVIYTRTEDVLLYDKNSNYQNQKKSMDLANRVKIAQETDDCIFVSIHMNSFPESKYNGLQIYYSKNNPSSRVLAEDIQLSVKNELQPNNKRKISEASSKIFILDRLTCPAVLIECGFLSNAEECRLLCTEIYQNQLSEIIAEKIQKYVEKNPQTY